MTNASQPLALAGADAGARDSRRCGRRTPKLIGTVGPGYTITLTKSGKKVTKLKAGKYTFVISDKASIHSYSLDGPNGFAKTSRACPSRARRRSR